MLRLRALLDAEDIKIEAYGPLNSLFRVTGGPVDAVVKSLAEKHGATEAQVLLSWAAKHSGGIAVTWVLFLMALRLSTDWEFEMICRDGC